MKVEHVNPFIQATSEVLSQVTGVSFATGKLTLQPSPQDVKSVLIVVGLTGAMRGQATLNMDEKTAKEIAKAMMMGMPVDELDELAKSAISELGNMIMGNSATILANNGVIIDITPPSLMVGENLTISHPAMQTIGVPLNSDIGTLLLGISVKE